ncbi:tetratricopeptide repeat protein, partial [Streptomyces palmae]
LLPRPPAGFVGRGVESALLTEAARSGAAPLCVVTGPAGVGKTSLAVHWAYRHADAYPDGVLYADLHPHTPGEPGPRTVEILHDFLSALGVPEERLPARGRAAEAMYRSLLADRRVLVLLDNAVDSAQVRPLLPGAPGCPVVVTSRNRLEGLVATDCARLLLLRRLSPDGGAAVLRMVVGDARVDAEPRAARDLSALCDGLPLALRLAAARLVARPGLSLRAMADDLLDEHRRLALLSTEDVGVEATLRLGRQQLPAAGELLFRQLALHVGAELDRGAAAALTGLSPAEADRALEELAAAHLLEERARGRYLMHDLIRLYARSGAAQAAPDGLRRLLVHYTGAALAATAAAEPGSQPCCTLPEGVAPVGPVPRPADRPEAMAWFAVERANLTAAVARAAETGHHAYAWRIAVAMWPLIVRQVHEGWEATLEHALGSALVLGDADAESRLRTLLGWVLTENGRHPQALEHLHRAPALAARAGDRPGEVIAMINWAAALERTGDLDAAGERREQAAAMARVLGHPHTETLALYHLADHCLTLGQPERALAHGHRALELAPEQQSEDRRALLLRTCAQALEALGRPAEARLYFAQAAELVADAEQPDYDPISH